MATPAELAAAHRRDAETVVARIVAAVLAAWDLMDPEDLDGSWLAIADRVAQLLALGQLQAAAQAAVYLEDQAAAQDLPAADAVVDPRAFAGVAADGRDLATLLLGGVIRTKAGLAAGMQVQEALQHGGAWLALTTAQEVAQAGRNADHVGLTGQTALRGYVRMLQPPSCGRCAILAGKWFEWNQGFARHPRCDCVHVPAAESRGVRDLRTDPRAMFDSLDPAEQARFAGSEASAQAIRDGADPAQVVNVYNRRNRRTEVDGSTYAPHSGLFTFDFGGRRVQYTNEGANVTRGRYGRAIGEATGQTDPAARRARGLDPTPDQFELADVRRLTPRSIYELAGDDRALAVDLLRRYGYLT
jgi:hypothetical protein